MSLPSVLLGRSGVLRLRDGHPWIFPDHLAGAAPRGRPGRGRGPRGGPRGGRSRRETARRRGADRIDARAASASAASDADSETDTDTDRETGAATAAVETSAGPEQACLVRLEGPAGTARGHAIWNPRSRIPLRLVNRDVREDLSPDFWRARLDAAIAARTTTLAPGEPACRWVHAEADGLPGLIVDRYADVAVLQAGCQWADELAPELAAFLVERHGVRGVLARHDGGFRRPEGLEEGITLLAGEVPHAVRWEAHGIARTIDPWTGQKTGAYLDQRENHRRAPERLPGGRILDAFCCDGGFSLSLARAGRQVIALDGSERELAVAQANAADNDLVGAIEWRKVNVFDHLRELSGSEERFDGVVLDPPALARRRAEHEDALRGYRELNLRALRLLRDGGRLLTCSCSFHVGPEEFLRVVAGAAADAGRDVRIVEHLGAAPCHPQRLAFPESAYLKVLLLEVTGTW
jgi:23S rRNA (cytosine1962-C5)-methyltransferase